MKATELRIGNYHYYTCEDSLDERKKWGEVCQIDSQDLVWLESNQDDEDFKPIPLTEEWLLKFGFEKLTDKKNGFKSNSYTYTKGILFIVHLNDKLLSVNFWQGNEKKYVHELQNLFFVLTGEELTI